MEWIPKDRTRRPSCEVLVALAERFEVRLSFPCSFNSLLPSASFQLLSFQARTLSSERIKPLELMPWGFQACLVSVLCWLSECVLLNVCMSKEMRKAHEFWEIAEVFVCVALHIWRMRSWEFGTLWGRENKLTDKLLVYGISRGPKCSHFGSN